MIVCQKGVITKGECKSMVIATDRAFRRLQQWFLDIGFRSLVKDDGRGAATVSITVDKQKHGDEIVWLHSIKLLLDQKTAARFKYYQLDYREEPDGTFFLRKV